MKDPATLTLREKQSLFARLIALLVLWIQDHGWEVTLADGAIDLRRRFRTDSGTVQDGNDAVHMRGSLHYFRLAQDLNLFVDGEFITDGGHPVWTAIGQKWISMHPLCRWGGNFPIKDSNHFSVEHEGKA